MAAPNVVMAMRDLFIEAEAPWADGDACEPTIVARQSILKDPGERLDRAGPTAENLLLKSTGQSRWDDSVAMQKIPGDGTELASPHIFACT